MCVVEMVVKMISGCRRANFKSIHKMHHFLQKVLSDYREFLQLTCQRCPTGPDHIMGVHLALLTMSAVRCPIGCGLHGATTFPFPIEGVGDKNAQMCLKNISATFCNVSHGADSVDLSPTATTPLCGQKSEEKCGSGAREPTG